LSELAEKMSVINESEQHALVGRAFYFNSSGDFLGEHGDGDWIMIAESTSDPGLHISTASEEVIGNVMTTIGGGIGISGAIGVSGFQGEYANAYATHDNGQVSVNYNSNLIYNGNYHDIVSILHHEHYHQMTQGYETTWLQNEYQAFIYQINHSSFQNVSDELREFTLTNYSNLHNSQTYP
jgi:hypothetical protein